MKKAEFGPDNCGMGYVLASLGVALRSLALAAVLLAVRRRIAGGMKTTPKRRK